MDAVCQRGAALPLAQLFWPQGDLPTAPQVYAVLDGARDARIASSVLASGLEQCCLFAGPLSRPLRTASPHLVHLTPGAPITDLLFNEGWHAHWGVLAVAAPEATLPVLRRHFRSLLQVKDRWQRRLLFRYYDPRVLQLYAATCDAAERRRLFGPLSALIPFGVADPLAACWRQAHPAATVDVTPLSLRDAQWHALTDPAQAGFRQQLLEQLVEQLQGQAPGELDDTPVAKPTTDLLQRRVLAVMHGAQDLRIRAPDMILRVARRVLGEAGGCDAALDADTEAQLVQRCFALEVPAAALAPPAHARGA